MYNCLGEGVIGIVEEIEIVLFCFVSSYKLTNRDEVSAKGTEARAFQATAKKLDYALIDKKFGLVFPADVV